MGIAVRGWLQAGVAGVTVASLSCCANPATWGRKGTSDAPAGTVAAPPTPTPPPPAGTPLAGRYDPGSPTVSDLWVDPARGNDQNSGKDASSPLRTLTAAWQKIPAGQVLGTTGYRLNLQPGTYPCEPGPEADNCNNYFERRWGTRAHPVILRATGGRGTVTIRGGFNFKDVRYLYLIDIDAVGGGKLPTNSAGNNLLHLEACDHVLLRGVTLAGPSCIEDSCNNLQEVLKANQVQHLYVEDSTIGGAWHSAVDYMVVQHGHVIGSVLKGAGQWCMYVKGGSAYIRVEGNELTGCELGIQAGQSANFAMMTPPWIRYEAYDIKVTGNLFHDLAGVPMSVAGGYNVLFAHNTAVRVATSARGYPLMQVVHGERNCTPTDEVPDPVGACKARISQGGWGPDLKTDGAAVIPSRNVWFYNNLFYNPSPLRTAYAHVNVAEPARPPAGFRNLPASVTVDQGLVFDGNVIWDGPKDHALGLQDEKTFRARNAVNTMEPQLANPGRGVFSPAPGGNVDRARVAPIPAFPWDEPVPAGTLHNPTGRRVGGL